MCNGYVLALMLGKGLPTEHISPRSTNLRRTEVLIIQGGLFLDTTELAHRVVDLVDEKQASDIVLLDLRPVSILADYFVICTAESHRQTKAILESVIMELKKEGSLPLHVEGTAESGWVLVDYGSIVLHVFAPPQRQYYQLEQFWRDATVVVKMQ